MIFKATNSAKLDIADAYAWYEEQQENLGEQFLLQFRAVRKALLLNPKGYRAFHNFREMPFKQFPYLALYEIIDNKIIVFAVFHTSQSPLKKKKS